MACRTVTGDIPVQRLGTVAPHEHIFIDMKVFFQEPEEIGAKIFSKGDVTLEKLGVLRRNPFAVLDNLQMTDERTQKEEIMYFKQAGGSTVVDVSTIGLGRDPYLLRKMAAETGLNIIAGSGFYVEGAQNKETLIMTEKEMEEQIVREIEVKYGEEN